MIDIKHWIGFKQGRVDVPRSAQFSRRYIR
jgi:hypothetical protein